MPASSVTVSYICARCLRTDPRAGGVAALSSIRHIAPIRRFADSGSKRQEKENENGINGEHSIPNGNMGKEDNEEREVGAMTRRLHNLSEDALASGSRSTANTMSSAGFSEELKRKLEDRIASATFRTENRNAFAESNLPSTTGRGTRDIATANPWTGEETIHDASLRMLYDAHKPLKLGRGPRIPGPSAALPQRVDTGRNPTKAATGTRLANARDRSGLYTSIKHPTSSMDEQERQKRFQELKDRFSPHARAVVPGTIQGLSSLANERIEDAIARGQFKNLPRGQKIERDSNASNPFLNTTEYFMNKMIQKQDIVPPWIEKQQELVSAATKFRARLRNDWKRHAARMIASQGGTLQVQVRKAEGYAAAERTVNPQAKKTETMNMMDDGGHVSQISLSGQLRIPCSLSDESTTETIPEKSSNGIQHSSLLSSSAPQPSPTGVPSLHPFRDPSWLATEHAYLSTSIADLNSKARSYNLLAPSLAKKPYFSLDRELNACYADVAPQLAGAIRERALGPKAKVEGFGANLAEKSGAGGLWGAGSVKIREERRERRYGLREFWKDIWGG